MITQVNAAAGYMSAVASALFGSKFFLCIGEIATNDDMPTWMKYLLGPMGALVGLIVALIWMNKRLDKAEAKIDQREVERDKDRKDLIEVLQKTNMVLDKSNSIHDRVEKTIIKCHLSQNSNQE